MTAAGTNSSEVFFLTPAASDSVRSGRGQLGRMQIWPQEPKFITEKLLLIARSLAPKNGEGSTPPRVVKKSIIAAFSTLKHRKSFLKQQRHDLCHLQLTGTKSTDPVSSKLQSVKMQVVTAKHCVCVWNMGWSALVPGQASCWRVSGRASEAPVSSTVTGAHKAPWFRGEELLQWLSLVNWGAKLRVSMTDVE